jgi:hypothetical protein
MTRQILRPPGGSPVPSGRGPGRTAPRPDPGGRPVAAGPLVGPHGPEAGADPGGHLGSVPPGPPGVPAGGPGPRTGPIPWSRAAHGSAAAAVLLTLTIVLTSVDLTWPVLRWLAWTLWGLTGAAKAGAHLSAWRSPQAATRP